MLLLQSETKFDPGSNAVVRRILHVQVKLSTLSHRLIDFGLLMSLRPLLLPPVKKKTHRHSQLLFSVGTTFK